MLTGYKYPGVFIPTVCTVRPNGDRVYISAKDHHTAHHEGSYIDRSVPAFFRPMVDGKSAPEVCRKYQTVQVHKRHYRLEEIA